MIYSCKKQEKFILRPQRKGQPFLLLSRFGVFAGASLSRKHQDQNGAALQAGFDLQGADSVLQNIYYIHYIQHLLYNGLPLPRRHLGTPQEIKP